MTHPGSSAVNDPFCHVNCPTDPSETSSWTCPGAYIDNFRVCNQPFPVYFTETLLAIHMIRKITDYGANITVTSEPGKGTTFRLYFPTQSGGP